MFVSSSIFVAVALASPPQVVVTDAQRAAAAATVVHEWGTFTSAHDPDGRALAWRVLGGGEPLPTFVHEAHEATAFRDRTEEVRMDPCRNKTCVARVRMETPVLYFHAPASTRFHVQVGFPEGAFTEWYPAVREIYNGRLDWGWVGIEPDLSQPLPRTPESNHYYAARNVRAATVRVDDEVERFLFYRGLGDFTPDVRPTTSASAVHWDGRGAQALVVYQHDADHEGAVRLDGPGSVPRGTLRTGDPRLLLRDALLAEGLFDDEVAAMLATWEGDWFGPGLRAFYVLPTAEVERHLPLYLDPAPAQVVRVLVGRAELLPPDLLQAARARVQEVPLADHERVLTEAYGRRGSAVRAAIEASASRVPSEPTTHGDRTSSRVGPARPTARAARR